jgi:hypothetical protein
LAEQQRRGSDGDKDEAEIETREPHEV